MRNVFKRIMGALVAGSALITAVPAQARHDGYRDYREYRGGYERHRYRDYDRRAYRNYRYRDYPRGGYYVYRERPRVYYRDHYRDDGAMIAAGLIGLAIGAAIASNRDRDYDRRGRYDRNYDYYGD